MPPYVTVTLFDGVRVVVPDSLNLITPYVLTEQQDWFEDEIKFLRRLLRAGHKVIDIGANFGVYTLSMARSVGPSGSIWAFEPATHTAGLLAQSISANFFAHVVLNCSALSNECGSARLALNDNSEMNALVRSATPTDEFETVATVTLDACMEQYRWVDIDFVKIDAEGEEANILSGGKRFFTELSPLVQYEIKAGSVINMDLLKQFRDLGYRSYRLVPGIDMLAPFDDNSSPDAFLLNLFSCKPDRAAELAADGFLIESLSDISWRSITNREKYAWQRTLTALPYGARLAHVWQTRAQASRNPDVDEALALYAISRDVSLGSCKRFGALQASFLLLKSLCERQPHHLRLASLARVACAFGARSLAVDALIKISNPIVKQAQVDPSEPFLAPAERFDTISPRESIGNWIVASLLEELERLGAYSSFYTGNAGRRRLEMIRDLGYASAEMHRRLQLVQRRFPAATNET